MTDRIGVAGSGRERPRAGREFRLAGRLVQPELNRVLRAGSVFQVEPKVMHVLLRLADRSGDVVTKEQLLEQVWEGVYVTEDVLVRAVGELRKLFEDDPARPKVIETIRKRGYRLIAPVLYDLPAPPVLEEAPPAYGAAAVASPPLWPARRVWLLTVVAVAGALAAGVWIRSRVQPAVELRFTPITSLVGNEYDPALSPDGTRVAFGWDGGADARTDLYVALLDGTPPLRLTDAGEDDRAPVWSPDGSRIAFVRWQPACEIRIVPALGGPSTRLLPCANPHHPRFSWSPDGRWLAVSRSTAEAGSLSGRIQLVALDSGDTRDLTSPSAAEGFDTSPIFSPDGRRIAFLRNHSDSVGDVFLVAAGGGAPIRLTQDNADVMGVTWTEGGRALVISSNRAGMYSLWRIAAEGGAPALLAGGGRKIKHPNAARVGARLAYESWNYDMNLQRLDLDAKGGAPAAGTAVAPASDEWTFEPQLSPDGRRVAFVSTRSGSYELWRADANGSRSVRLTSFGGPYVGAPRWSPDGTRLVFFARPGGPAEVYVIAAEGGRPARVALPDGDAVAPSWSADGRALYYGSRRDGDWQIYRVAIGGGEPRRVTSAGGYAAAESADGRWLYFSRIERPGLWRMPVAGGSEERITPDLQPEDWAGWGVTAKGVFWTVHDLGSAPAAVALLENGAAAPRRIAMLPDLGWPGVTLSDDARTLVYSRVDHRDSNLVQLSSSPPGH